MNGVNPSGLMRIPETSKHSRKQLRNLTAPKGTLNRRDKRRIYLHNEPVADTLMLQVCHFMIIV